MYCSEHRYPRVENVRWGLTFQPKAVPDERRDDHEKIRGVILVMHT